MTEEHQTAKAVQQQGSGNHNRSPRRHRENLGRETSFLKSSYYYSQKDVKIYFTYKARTGHYRKEAVKYQKIIHGKKYICLPTNSFKELLENSEDFPKHKVRKIKIEKRRGT